jgi:hypothetical protein
MMKRIMMAAAALWLAGEAQAKTLEDNRQQLVNEYIRSTFLDPYSIRDLMIGHPIPALIWWKPGIFGNRKDLEDCYIIGFRCNAKNSFGAYVGQRVMAIVICRGYVDANKTETINSWLNGQQGAL